MTDVLNAEAVEAPDRNGPMRFSVDAWDPTYGTSVDSDLELADTSRRITEDVELPTDRWRALDVDPCAEPPASVLFVDGVRRIDARVWIDDDPSAGSRAASAGICASYAAGVVCCCTEGSHLLFPEVRRGLFSTATHAGRISTSAGPYEVSHTPLGEGDMPSQVLSLALQRQLADLEVEVAQNARRTLSGHGTTGDADLLVIDGPLWRRQDLPRAIGFIKTHRTEYLSPALHAMIGTLQGGQRTPVFLMGTSWDRHAWYLRLPCAPGAPWAGVVRLECSAGIPAAEAIALANLSQVTLCRYASTEYKDPRAPQNLYPVGGLERELRRRLGDARVLFRALRLAATN